MQKKKNYIQGGKRVKFFLNPSFASVNYDLSTPTACFFFKKSLQLVGCKNPLHRQFGFQTNVLIFQG